MSQKSGQYKYQKNTTTTTSSNARNSANPKVNSKLDILKNKDFEFYKCNKCGKYKYRLGAKKTINETGTMTRKTVSLEKYDKYNTASKTICSVCGNPKMKCKCKKDRSTSMTTTLPKRSSNLTGKIDLTPKVKVNLDPDKIKKAVEEQKRMAEEAKRRKDKEKEKAKEKKEKEIKTYKPEEKFRKVIKEEKYTYNKTKELDIKEEDLCHCGDENCEKKEKIEELQFKNTPVKTFYSEYIQKKYTIAEVPFPERRSYLVNITQEMINTNSNINANFNQNLFIQNANIQRNQFLYAQNGNMECPGCGRMLYNQMNNFEIVQRNDAAQNEECLCPECNKEVIEQQEKCLCPREGQKEEAQKA